MFLKKSVLGLDIGSTKTKIVHLKCYQGKYELSDYISIDNPNDAVENGVVVRPELLGEKIGEVVKEYKLRGKKTISAISGSQVYIKNLIMPKMKPRELRQAVYYQATTFLPVPVEETVIDIFPLRDFESETGIRTEVFFVAARKEQVENLEKCCKTAGLNLQVVDLEPLALHRIIERPKNIESFALLNVEDTRSSFSVFKGENLLFHRSLATGFSFNSYQPVSDDYFKREILMDVIRSVEYYNLQFNAYPEAIILCGQGLKLAELKNLLSENIDVEILTGNFNSRDIKLDHLSEKDCQLLVKDYLIALGLAIRGGV